MRKKTTRRKVNKRRNGRLYLKKGWERKVCARGRKHGY